MGKGKIYEQGLDRSTANFTQLSPLSFIGRTAAVYPDHVSVIHGQKRFTWSETYARCRRLAGALAKREIGVGDTVTVMGSNTPEMVEAAFGVPMCGATLNTLNVRLDADTIAFCLNNGEAKVLITDTEFSETVKQALADLGRDIVVIDIDDTEADEDISRERLGERTMRRCWRKATRTSTGIFSTTNGRPSRSTSRRAPPATPRAWSIITAAPI